MLGAAAAAQAAPTTLGVERAATRVAAHNGVVMWSRFNPNAKNYVLLRYVGGGAVTRVRVPPRSAGPFDIDLGTNSLGATYAVYTRDDGDIYRLNVTTGSELKVAKLSSPTQAERDPTIMRGEIAFVRRSRGYDQLRIGNASSRSRGSRLILQRRALVGAELGITHIAYVVAAPGPISGDGAKYVRIRDLGTGAERQVYSAISDGLNLAGVTRPTYVATPPGFMWARTNQGLDTGNRLVRYTLRGSRLAYAQGSPLLTSTAWAGDLLGAAVGSAFETTAFEGGCDDEGVNFCTVQLSGPLAFNLGP